MPWHVGKHESCSGFAVIKDSDGSVAGCHTTEEDAKKQLAALYASESRAKYDHIDFKPPEGVRKEAAKGLEWRRQYGRGGTAIGIARARDLSNGVNISPETAKRMKAYFDRHEVDKQGKGWSPGEDGFPSNGRIAWALWGSDPGWAWSRKLVEQINAADKERNAPMEIERRWISHEEVEEGGVPSLRIETRADGSTSRDWIVGYAAKFGVNSLDMGDFIERIDPGAFSIVAERRGRKRPLETRALFNHDPNHVLGRFPTTLRMTVDEVGLRYEVLPPESRQDIVESIRRGDISGSSFSFVIAQNGEKWSMEDGRSIRTITSVSALYDVGPVTFPAYPDSDVSVAKRSYDQFMRSVARRSEADKYVESRRRQAANDIQSFLRERGR